MFGNRSKILLVLAIQVTMRGLPLKLSRSNHLGFCGAVARGLMAITSKYTSPNLNNRLCVPNILCSPPVKKGNLKILSRFITVCSKSSVAIAK